MNIKQKVKALLQKDRTEAEIASQLSIPRSRVVELKKEIIEDRKRWNKKKRILEDHYPLIMNCLRKKQDAKQIHAHLISINVRLSYSTVARYIASLFRNQNISIGAVTPGSEGKVFFFPIGKFKKEKKTVESWIFIMRLSYSKYAFYRVVSNGKISTFLDCHLCAFYFFNGAPHTLRINQTRALNINFSSVKESYISFLRQFGCVLVPKNKRDGFINCQREIRHFKENFQYQILHRNYGRLIKALDWYIERANLGMHPLTRNIISKEFRRNEQPNLLPFKYNQYLNVNQNELERKKN